MDAMHRRLVLPFLALTLAAGCPSGRTPPPAEPVPGDSPSTREGQTIGNRATFTDFTLEDSRLVLPGPIVFEGDATLDVDASANALWYIHDYLEAKPYVTLVRIEGHGLGGTEEQVMMTGERALVVGRWLVKQGIACDRLLAAAFGDSKPVADGSHADGRAANERIAVVNATLRGTPIGGMPVDGSAAAAVPVCD